MLKTRDGAHSHLSPEQQREILLLAERLQTERASHATLDELSRAASEAGIVPAYVEEAYKLLNKEKTSKAKERRSDLPQIKVAAVLALVHLVLYQFYPSVLDWPLGILIVGLGIAFGFLNARGWTRNTLAILAGPAISLGTFLVAVLVSKLSTSFFAQVQWLPAKEIVVFLTGGILAGIVAGKVWEEVRTSKSAVPELPRAES